MVSDELLERFICEYVGAQDNPRVFSTRQGGEPALAGLVLCAKICDMATAVDRYDSVFIDGRNLR